MFELGTSDSGIPICTIHNSWHLNSHSTNFLMASSIKLAGFQQISMLIKKFPLYSTCQPHELNCNQLKSINIPRFLH
jgi:hypothetical protein